MTLSLFHLLHLVSSLFLCLPVVLFLVEDNGTAVVLSTIAGSGVQGTAVSETLYVPEPVAVARHPLLQDRLALRACRHRPPHRGAAASRKLHYR